MNQQDVAYPGCKLEAVQKSELPSFTPVWNSDELDYYLWVHVPSYIARDFSLYQLEEMSEPIRELRVRRYCVQERPHPWYRIVMGMLNRTPGLHVYRMSFVNCIDDVAHLFFAYTIQCDHPPKPYKYMERTGKCECS